MNTQVTLILPQSVYRRAKQLAQQTNKQVNTLLTELLAESIGRDDNELVTTYELDEAVEREKQAYLTMHPTLFTQYPGQHVAIHLGKLVDRDVDLDALWERVEKQYPNEYVWVTTVQSEAIETVRIPSFEFVAQRDK